MTTELLIDRQKGELASSVGKRFHPGKRQWTDGLSSAQDPITASDALQWLQRESGSPMRVPIGVIGTRTPTERQSKLAFQIGHTLAKHGITVLCGGRAGVMEHVCEGVASAGGISVGLLPDGEPEAANPFVTIPIATGIGVARNALIARAAFCLVAVGGHHGTLSEIAFGLQFQRPVICLANSPEVEGCISCSSADDVIETVARIALNLN